MNTRVINLCCHHRATAAAAAVRYISFRAGSNSHEPSEIASKIQNFTTPLNECEKILYTAISQGLADQTAWNAMVMRYASEGSIVDAEATVAAMKKHKVVPTAKTYHTIISHCAKHADVDTALRQIRQMEDSRLTPNIHCYQALLTCYTKSGDMEGALQCFDFMRSQHFLATSYAYGVIIDGFCLLGDMDKALAYFKEMKDADCEPSVIVFNSFIMGYSKKGDMASALQWMKNLQKEGGYKPTLITYTNIIDGYARLTDTVSAFRYFDLLCASGLQPDVFVYNILLLMCQRNNLTQKKEELMERLKKGGLTMDTTTLNAFLSSTTSGPELIARFEEMRSYNSFDRFSYNFLLYGLAKHKMIAEMHKYYAEMVALNIKPTTHTYSALLRALLETGKYHEVIQQYNYLKSMSHSSTVIDMTYLKALAHTGNVEKIMTSVETARKQKRRLPDVFAFSELISIVSKLSKDTRGLCEQLWGLMKECGVKPTSHTYRFMVSAYALAGSQSDEPKIQALLEGATIDKCLNPLVLEQVQMWSQQANSHRLASMYANRTSE